MWWVIFNKPSECAGTGDIKCSFSDVTATEKDGQSNLAEIAIIHASGGVSNVRGFIRMSATLYMTPNDLNLVNTQTNAHTYGGPYKGPSSLYEIGRDGSKGYSSTNAEVHIAIRDHGEPTDNTFLQTNQYIDPSCIKSEPNGQNTCADCGYAKFSPLIDGGTETSNPERFSELFPIGCGADGNCTLMEDEVQLSSNNVRNEVTLSRIGDSIQAIAELRVPSVRVSA